MATTRLAVAFATGTAEAEVAGRRGVGDGDVVAETLVLIPPSQLLPPSN